MALHLNREIRPNVVLECSFEQKPYLRESKRRKLGFWEEVRFGANPAHLSKILQEEERRKLGQRVPSDLR